MHPQRDAEVEPGADGRRRPLSGEIQAMRIKQPMYARIERTSMFACQVFAVLCMAFAVLALKFGLLGSGRLSSVRMWLLFVFAFVPYAAGHNCMIKGWLVKRVVP